MEYRWDVMYLCERQLRDVRAIDVLCGGLYRRCDTYKGGGGYDKFPAIYNRRMGTELSLNEQFVVQLRGCPLKCPYCYVTEDGVHTGRSELVSTRKLVEDFDDSDLDVFHLMGGAPALYINHWEELIERLNGSVFHSDLMLVEGRYNKDVIERLAGYENTLYAVSIKGGNAEEFRKNTCVEFDERLFFANFDTIVECGLPFYLTFTGMSVDSTESFKRTVTSRYGKWVLDDCFSIDIVEYEALK